VDEGELSLRRSQMGRGCQPWVVHGGPRAVGGVAGGAWLMLTGAPSPDVNMALVHDGDAQTLATTKQAVEAAGFPTLFMVAGRSKGSELDSGWQHVGAMPFMSSMLDDEHLRADARVRQAGESDFDTVVELLGDVYGMTHDVAEVCALVLRAEPDAMHVWLLVDGEQAVSTVMTTIVDDVVCVWCMGTPARFARRGHGRALLGDVLLRAKNAGATIGLLGATPAGRPLYEATGWQTLEEWELFVNAESTQFPH
jgi:GNAT superfamily N-acetyltransferase